MNRTHPNFLPAHLRKNSSCVSDYIPQSVSEEVEVCTTSSSEHRSHTEIPSYNTDVVPIEENKIVTGFMKTDHNVTRTEIQIMP